MPDVRLHVSRQVFGTGKCMQAEPVVADTHLFGGKGDVLQAGILFLREREIFLDQPGTLPGSGNLFCRQAAQTDEPAVVHNPLELFHCFDEAGGAFPVCLFRDNEAPAKRAEVTLPAAPFPRGLCQIEVTGMAQVRTLVKVAFKRTAKEAHVVFLNFRLILFTHKPILLMYHAEVRQHFHRLAPRGMYRFVFRRCHRIKFRQCHFKSGGHVRIL